MLRLPVGYVADTVPNANYLPFTVTNSASTPNSGGVKLIVTVVEARAEAPLECDSPQCRPPNIFVLLTFATRAYALVETGATVCVMDTKLCSLLQKVTVPLSWLSLCKVSTQHMNSLAACTACY